MKLCQYHGASKLGCKPIDEVLGNLSSNQINIATFSPDLKHISPIWWTKVAIFIWFELWTPSASPIGSHWSRLVPCYWQSFFVNGIKHYRNCYCMCTLYTVTVSAVYMPSMTTICVPYIQCQLYTHPQWLLCVPYIQLQCQLYTCPQWLLCVSYIQCQLYTCSQGLLYMYPIYSYSLSCIPTLNDYCVCALYTVTVSSVYIP